MLSLLKNILFRRLSNAVAAGTSTVNSASVDLEDTGARSVLFGILFGTLTSTNVNTITIQGSTDDVTFVDYENDDVAFTVPDDQDNKLVLCEIIKPKYRYVRVEVARATANAVIDGIFAAISCFHRNSPITQGAEVSAYGQISAVSPDLEV
jgi:hypothetical protein